jgi:thiamine-phosphate pyrophosphorylase
MSEPQGPQIYLITPQVLDWDTFPGALALVLDAAPVACLRLSLATRDEDTLMRAGDSLREIAHQRDIPLVIDNHLVLVERLGLDGVHLTDAHASIRAARKALGADAIIGSFCGTSRHDGLTAAEAGADYVSFGPVSGSLGDGQLAEFDLFSWWSEVIEVPIVAEGGLTEALIDQLAPVADFLALGEEVWSSSDPAAHLAAVAKRLGVK